MGGSERSHGSASFYAKKMSPGVNTHRDLATATAGSAPAFGAGWLR